MSENFSEIDLEQGQFDDGGDGSDSTALATLEQSSSWRSTDRIRTL